MPQIQGAFPTVKVGLTTPLTTIDCNLSDQNTLNAVGRTDGVQLLVPVPVAPTITKPWTISGWGIAWQGALNPGSPSSKGSPFGLLGRLIAGPIFGSAGVSSTGYFSTFQNIPAEALLNVETLWDGGQDGSFPFLNNGIAAAGNGAHATSYQLPQPVQLAAGDAMAMGLWLTPSLVAWLQIFIFGARYTILYD